LAENVLDTRWRSYPARIWPKTRLAPRMKHACYVSPTREHTFENYVVWQLNPAPSRRQCDLLVQSGPTTIAARKAPSTTRGYVRTVKTLIELLELPGGWNSYNAKPIRKENVTFAVDLLSRLMHENTPEPDVVPKVRGGVQLEWHTGGVNLEISIDSPNNVKFFAEDIAGSQEAVEEDLDETILARWVDRISGQVQSKIE
jgi:hypothetical protein